MSDGHGGPFREPGERVTLWHQAPRLASALPVEQQAFTLVFPLDAAEWHPVRTACVACMQRQPELALVRWLPGLAELDGLELTDDRGLPPDVTPLPPRIYHALLEDLIGWGRARTWAELGSLSVLELGRISGVGVASLPLLLEMIVDIGVHSKWPRTDVPAEDDANVPPVDATVPAYESPQPGPAGTTAVAPESELAQTLVPLVSMVATIGTWAVVEHGVSRIEEAFERAASDQAPAEIRDAIALLRSANLPPQSAPDIGALIDALLASLPDARRMVFEARVLQPSGGTLEAIGERLGITRERVRQIEVAACRSVIQQLSSAEYRWLRWRAHSVRRKLGSLIPVGDPYTKGVLASAIGSEATDRETAFLMWAAGPYELRDGMWVAEAPRGAGVDAKLLAAIPAAGLTDEELASVLAELGIPAVFAEAVMAWLPRTHRVLDRWFPGPLTIPDYCAVALHHLGRPATVAEILELTRMDRDHRSATNRLQADDRFVRVSKDAYALREWGYEEYAGIADAIARAIEVRGGFAHVADLMREISEAFGVSPSSVRAYADAPMFVLEGNAVRMRRSGETFIVSDQLPSRRRTYRYGSVIVLVLDVDRDVLRGSGRPLLADVTQALGVSPGTVRRFEGDDFEVTVSWPKTGWMGGSIGSLRGAVASAGADRGQRLRLSFNVGAGTVRVIGIDDVVLNSMEPLAALRRLTGAPGSTAADVLMSLDMALVGPVTGVEAALRGRGDHDVADLVQRVMVSGEQGTDGLRFDPWSL